MSIYKSYTEEDFGQWVFSMEDKLYTFIDSLYGDVKNKLDYSAESLNVAEKWIRENYSNSQDLDKVHRAITTDGWVRYVGEVFRKYTGGFWDMEFNSAESICDGPFLVIEKNCSLYPYLEIKNSFSTSSDEYLLSKLLNKLNDLRAQHK